MVKLVSMFWIFTAVIGFFVYGYSGRSDYTFYNIYPSDLYCLSSVAAHFLSAFGLYFGYTFCVRLNSFSVKSLGSVLYEFSVISGNKYVVYINFSVAIVSIFSHIFTYGFGDLLSRDYYMPEAGGVAPVIAQLSAIVGLILASLTIGSNDFKIKLVGLFLSVLFVLLMFSKGSRFSVAGFVLALIIPIMSSSKGEFKYYKLIMLIILIVSVVPLLHVVLYFRSDSVYGLFIYLQKFGDALNSLPDGDFQSVWDIVFNLTFSVPVTEITTYGDNSINNILIALNPAPGGLAGWYEIADLRRVSVDVPYSAMGELYGYSPLVCFLYMLIAGYFITYIQFYSENFSTLARFVGLISAVSLGLLFAILAPQYPLRNITRLVYYMLLIFILIKYVDGAYKIRNKMLLRNL